MPTATYIPLANITLTTAAASVTFSSISQQYRDLIIVHNNFGTVNNDANSYFRFNSDTGSNYSRRYAFAEGASSTRVTGTDGGTTLPVFGARTTVGLSISQITDYSMTDRPKTILTRTDTGNHLVWMSAGRWASNSAITTILLHPSSGNFAAGFTAAIYGIAS